MKLPFNRVSHFRSLCFDQITLTNTLGKKSRMGTVSDLFYLCSNSPALWNKSRLFLWKSKFGSRPLRQREIINSD